MGHVGNLVGCVNQEPIIRKFSEFLLAYMDGDPPVFVFDPSKCTEGMESMGKPER